MSDNKNKQDEMNVFSSQKKYRFKPKRTRTNMHSQPHLLGKITQKIKFLQKKRIIKSNKAYNLNAYDETGEWKEDSRIRIPKHFSPPVHDTKGKWNKNRT